MKTMFSLLAIAVLTMLSPLHVLGQSQPNSAAVKIDNFRFAPQTLTVHPGTTVTWVNRDDVPHTVMSVDKKFGSNALDTDERFSFTFAAPGTYKYYCSVHPHMTGKIIVQ